MKNTEKINENTQDLDLLAVNEFVKLYLEEDKQVHRALEKAQAEIAQSISLIAEKFLTNDYFQASLEKKYKGPRLFYIGAGTSGRLGVLDASECPPTFSCPPEMVQGIIAGGDQALRSSIEGAEDDEAAGYKIISETLLPADTLVALSANGWAPYVLGALKAAHEKGCLTIAIANNQEAEIFKYSKQRIFLDTGAEILSGSTRLKAGTAQKITLNMISTGLMVQLHKVFSNLMVDVKASNKKLVARAVSLVQKISSCDSANAQQALEACDYKVKTAALMLCKKLSAKESEDILKSCNGNLREALA